MSQEARLTPTLVKCVTHALVGAFFFGYTTSVLNVPAATIQKYVNHNGDPVPDTLWATVVALFPVGALAGTFISGPLADRWGRRTYLLMVDIVFIIASIVSGLSVNVFMLAAARAVLGACSGAATVVAPTYLNEISPTKWRGAIGTLFQVFITLGIVLVTAFGKLFSTESTWRYGVAGGAILPVIQIFLFRTFPESPRWLLEQGKTQEANELLSRLHGYAYQALEEPPQEGDEEIADMGDMQTDTPATSRMGVAQKTRTSSVSSAMIQSLFAQYKHRPVIRRVVYLSLFVHGLQQLSGINSAFYYSNQILQAAGVQNAFLGALLVAIANFLSVIAVTPLIDRWGRQYLLVRSALGMALSAALLTLAFIFLETPNQNRSAWGIVAMFAFMLYVASFEIGLGPIPWLYVAELTPIQIRATLTSIAQFVNYSCNTIIALTGPDLIKALGAKYVFIPFCGICLIGAGVLSFYPETKNKSVEEVLEDLGEGMTMPLKSDAF